ncbi:hypothetical protein HDU91_000573 [Kappamyces sp. JEL0680]|nr:hypothetical protein HDU91_000573 [Kappamyces sp. JEL0680]
MYNVAKGTRPCLIPVSKGNILAWFNEIFDALTKLSVDVELSVKNGSELLDRLMKDIVAERSSYYHPDFRKLEVSPQEADAELHPLSPSYPSVPGSGPYPVINAPGRFFLVQWIYVLNSVPDLELVTFLPDFLDGLFVFLSDPHVDVRTATLTVLGEFLREITNVVGIQKDTGVLQIAATPTTELEQLSVADAPSQEPRAEQQSGITAAGETFAVTDQPYVPGQGVTLDFGRMTNILAKYVSSTDQETQATALRWINSFIGLARNKMLPYTPLLLGCILPTLAHANPTIKALAIDSNTNLFTMVQEFGDDIPAVQDLRSDNPFDTVGSISSIMELTQHENEDTRIASLEWLVMLHKKYPVTVMNSDHTLIQGLLKILSDFSEEVVRRDLQLLAQISNSNGDEYFHKFMMNLMNLFTMDRRLLETRGSLIIRQLCLSLNPERMYRSFGDILEQESDLEFATTMVQTLHLILITAPEMAEMRRRLKNIESRDGFSLFSSLYKSWCHNPIACFSLCLLSQAYEHASNLMTLFGELEITVAFLIQTDKLVQLIESPVFTSLRLQLLEPDKYPHLYKCLYGILMLLPQSSAFATLRNRLNCLGSLAALPTFQSSTPSPPMSKRKGTEAPISAAKWTEFLTHFRTVQNRHERARRACKLRWCLQ